MKNTIFKKSMMFILAIVMTVGCALSLTGCGQKEDTAIDTPHTESSETSDEGVLSETLTVGICPDYEPFIFYRDGSVVGFDMNVIECLSGNFGLRYDLKEMDWDQLMYALEHSEVDMAISAIPITEEHMAVMDFSQPYYETLDADGNITEQYAIAFPKGSPYVETIDSMLSEISSAFYHFEEEWGLTDHLSGMNDDSDLTENNEEAQEQPSVTGVIEWLDFYKEATTGDGYELNEHLHISKWISADDTATIEAAWAEVGKGHEFPSETQLGYGTHGSGTYSTVDGFGRLDYDGMYYAIGYLEVTNETEGFDIDSNNTLTYNLGLTMLTKFEPCHLLLSYSNSNDVYYCHYGSMLDGTRNSIYFTMTSNHWGTIPIVLALPVDRTPNYPDGNPSPAEATFMFGGTEFTLE